MGWSFGYSEAWGRDIGYGVPAWCDHPDCAEVIHRGLDFKCGHEPEGRNPHGCGLYFCPEHLGWGYDAEGNDLVDEHGNPYMQRCDRCIDRRKPFEPKPDHPRWIHHKLTDSSWNSWRAEHVAEVKSMAAALADTPYRITPFAAPL